MFGGGACRGVHRSCDPNAVFHDSDFPYPSVFHPDATAPEHSGLGIREPRTLAGLCERWDNRIDGLAPKGKRSVVFPTYMEGGILHQQEGARGGTLMDVRWESGISVPLDCLYWTTWDAVLLDLCRTLMDPAPACRESTRRASNT